MAKRAKLLVDRFREKFDEGAPDECWEWQAGMFKSGYGAIRLGPPDNKVAYAHRVSYELHVGGIPDGLCVLHRCDNPSCVNPGHLFLGTRQENMEDKVRKGRQNRGSSVGTSKLHEGDVREIRLLGSRGLKQEEIAERFGVTASRVSDVLSGRAWKHVG